ncbi:MAG: hypothetical protein JWO36_6172 [Myxococcales bacterium]|nr:hypothetical protein [Myxococcales bacterium]
MRAGIGRSSLSELDSVTSEAQPAAKQPSVGRSTLSQQLAFEDDPRKAPMFEGVPQWEDIEPDQIAEPNVGAARAVEGNLAAHHDAPATADDVADDPEFAIDAPAADHTALAREAAPTDLASTEAAPSEAAPTEAAPTEAPPSEAAPASETSTRASIASAAPPAQINPTGPQHAGAFEHHAHGNKPHYAHQDKYNRPSIKSPAQTNDKQIRRPGVRVGDHDEFSLNVATAHRYRIVNNTHGQQVDDVNQADIDAGQRLALNPAHVRKLTINGKPVSCVMSWYGQQGSAWIPVHVLKGDTNKIKHAVENRAKHWDPAAAPTKHVARFQFRPAGDPIAYADDTDRRTFITPNQKSDHSNHVADYLGHSVATSLGPSPARRNDYNITMNLPSKSAPPVAIDMAQPGETFFVPKGKTFRREIETFEQREPGKPHGKPVQMQTWVYGFVGKKHGSKIVPDKSRRGWVPLRVLQHPASKKP